MGLIDQQQRLVPGAELANGLVVPGIGQHDPDVREGRLEQAEGDVAFGECPLETLQVVDLDHPRRFAERHGRAEVPLARDHVAGVIERREGLVDRAVIVPVVDDDLGAAGDLACPPDREPIGVGGGQTELPVRDAEPPSHLPADPRGVLGRQHQGDPSRRLLCDRVEGHLRRMSGHAACVTQTEVHEGVAVHVPEPRALGAIDENRMVARPAGHPVHRNAEEQRGPSVLGELLGSGVAFAEQASLTLHQVVEPCSVDRLHVRVLLQPAARSLCGGTIAPCPAPAGSLVPS